MTKDAKTKNVDSWFWILKDKPSKSFLKGYFAVTVIVFFYGLFLIK